MKVSVKHLPIFLAAVTAGTVAGISAWRFAIYGKLNYAKLLGELRYDAGYLDGLYGRDYAGNSKVVADLYRGYRSLWRRSGASAAQETEAGAIRNQMAEDLAEGREPEPGPEEDW